MGKSRMLVFVLFIALGLLPLTALAAEELFDTKTASDHIEKGIAKLKAGSYDAAIGEFEEASSISPDAEAYYYLGYAYYMKGKKTGDGDSRKKSLEYFNEAYEIDPNFTPSRYKPAMPQEQQPAPAAAAPETAPSAPATEPAATAPAEPAPSTPPSNGK